MLKFLIARFGPYVLLVVRRFFGFARGMAK
jgi:hypothetical protein